MQVKIGNKIFNSKDTPIMLSLSDKEKKQIANMHPDVNKYISPPTSLYWSSPDGQRLIARWINGEDVI